ncbi:MAG: magnesium/cobalt transporter CorA [Anaerolineales bacterium]
MIPNSTLLPDPAMPSSLPRLLIWQNGAIRTDFQPEALREAVHDPHALVWLDIAGPDGPVEATLRDVFGLSPITIQSLREPKARARFVEQAGYFSLVVHGMAFDSQANTASTPKLDIIIGKSFIITAHAEPLAWLDELFAAAGRDGELLLAQGMAFLLHALLDALVDSYFPVLDDLDDIIDDLEDVTVNSTSNEVQVRIFRIKRALAQMRRVISPQVEVANALAMRGGKLIPAEAQPYFAEVHDHLIRAFEVLDSYRDLMSGILDVYLTSVSNRVNAVMKQLAIIATIFLPLTFITGVFGQNFGHLPQVEHDTGLWFWGVLAFMGMVTLVQVWLFRKRGWL